MFAPAPPRARRPRPAPRHGLWAALLLAMPLVSLAAPNAEPIRVSGAVPDEAAKARIVERLRTLYPERQVLDELKVQSDLRSPPQWTEQVLRLLRPELKQVSVGSLQMRGAQIDLSGQLAAPNQIDPLQRTLRAELLNSAYQFAPRLRSGTPDQSQLDALLARRNVEFESGKDLLTNEGRAVLAELLPLLRQFGAQRRFEIVGHTDAVGSAEANLQLSAARAEAVRRHLIEAGMPAAQLQTLGAGASQPLASNATAEGKARNRRIEIRVLA